MKIAFDGPVFVDDGLQGRTLGPLVGEDARVDPHSSNCALRMSRRSSSRFVRMTTSAWSRSAAMPSIAPGIGVWRSISVSKNALSRLPDFLLFRQIPASCNAVAKSLPSMRKTVALQIERRDHIKRTSSQSEMKWSAHREQHLAAATSVGYDERPAAGFVIGKESHRSERRDL